MSRWNEREIARKLAERDPLEPPAGLLEKIKSEIPPTIPVGVPQGETRRPLPGPQRWLIAASLVAMVGAGFFALRLRMEAPPMEASPAAKSPAVKRKVDEVRTAPVPQPVERPQSAVLPPARLQEMKQRAEGGRAPQAPPPPADLPKLLAKKEKDQLKALGYVSPQGSARGQMQGGASAGVVGGTPGAPPSPAAPAQAAPAPAAAAPPAAEPEETITVTAESPLLDQRRVDRVNVGGNEAGRQSQYVGPGHPSEPFEDVAVHPVSTFRLDAGTASGGEAPRDLAAGKHSEAGSNRVDALKSYFDYDAFSPARARGAVAITAEGAPAPFVHGPRFRLLRFHVSGVPTGAPVEVSFNPAVVARYRLVGAGTTGLYEIELRPDAPGTGRVATLRLSDQAGNGREVALSAFAPSWEKASPHFRLAALAARFGEILQGSPGTARDLEEIARQVRKAGRELPASSRAAELADLVEKTARLRD